jgi:CRP-like cAMP-binding protein
MAATAPSSELARQLLSSHALTGAWQEVRLGGGDVLFRRGDPGDTFYVVVDGTLDVVTADGVLLERLGAGASFGELAILDEGPRSATVVCVTAVTLRALRRDDFLTSLARDPVLADTAIALLGERMRRNAEYLDYVTTWARLMAEGRYASARAAIQADALLRSDANLGRFVQTFTTMVDAVQDREAALARQIRDLQIEIDTRRQAIEVAEITESDFFRDLERSAAEMRRRVRERPATPSRSECGDDAH